jgi:hypothetical protein
MTFDAPPQVTGAGARHNRRDQAMKISRCGLSA